MADEIKKDNSLLNPLHGGDNHTAAISLRDEDFTSLRPEDVEEKVDASNFNKIILICSGVVFAWLIIYGLIYFASQVAAKNSKNKSSVAKKHQVIEQSLFQRTFCQGSRRSSFCD